MIDTKKENLNIKKMQKDMENNFNRRDIQYYIDLLKSIKFPNVNLPRINLRSMRKPPKWLFYTIIILIQFILLFFILWLFDERTVFDNDYYVQSYRGQVLKWGWFHLGMVITTIIIDAGLFLTFLIGELMAWKDEERVFYNFYR